ncbi:MAG: hypothetical protein FJ104_17785 [Deltaproteobacteria bacterium]|nr:hypothetical protein [Deltaproteobacteria bacterium]
MGVAPARASGPGLSSAPLSGAALCEGEYRLASRSAGGGRGAVALIRSPLGARLPLRAAERRLLELAGRAASNRQIELELELSESSVENLLSRLLRRIGVESRAELVRLFTQLERRAAQVA